MFGRRFNIRPHLAYLRRTRDTAFRFLNRTARTSWGLRYPILLRYYKSIFLGIVSYAAGAWGDLVLVHYHRRLQSLQRGVLLKVTKAYKTTSTAALQIVAGVHPLHLHLELRRKVFLSVRKGRLRADDLELTQGSPHLLRQQIANHITRKWQTNWQGHPGAPITKAFLPSVHRRLRMTWLHPNHHLTQYLTGHGDFSAKLYSFGLSEHPLCVCGEEETSVHIILHCGLYEDARDLLRRSIAATGIRWPPRLSRTAYPSFQWTGRQFPRLWWTLGDRTE